MSSTQATARRTHHVPSRSLLITFQKREIRDAFVSALFNQGPTWMKRATPNLACVIYVLPQQIASQGNQPFIFWDIKLVEKEIPPALTSSWYQPFSPPLWNIKAVVEGEHADALSYLWWNKKVRWYDSQPPLLTWLYSEALLHCSCCRFNRRMSRKSGCGGFCCCLKSQFRIIVFLNIICLLSQRRFLPLIVSPGNEGSSCVTEGSK